MEYPSSRVWAYADGNSVHLHLWDGRRAACDVVRIRLFRRKDDKRPTWPEGFAGGEMNLCRRCVRRRDKEINGASTT